MSNLGAQTQHSSHSLGCLRELRAANYDEIGGPITAEFLPIVLHQCTESPHPPTTVLISLSSPAFDVRRSFSVALATVYTPPCRTEFGGVFNAPHMCYLLNG